MSRASAFVGRGGGWRGARPSAFIGNEGLLFRAFEFFKRGKESGLPHLLGGGYFQNRASTYFGRGGGCSGLPLSFGGWGGGEMDTGIVAEAILNTSGLPGVNGNILLTHM